MDEMVGKIFRWRGYIYTVLSEKILDNFSVSRRVVVWDSGNITFLENSTIGNEQDEELA